MGVLWSYCDGFIKLIRKPANVDLTRVQRHVAGSIWWSNELVRGKEFYFKWGSGTVKVAIGPKIKDQREQREWSQQVLAEKLRVSRQTISKWELGKSYPDLESLVMLAQLFGVSADYLLGMTQPVVKRPWYRVWFRKGSKETMGTTENHSVKWYSSGQARAKAATAIMMDLVANLNQTTERPFRQLIGNYYRELVQQQSGSNMYVFERMGIEISACLRKNGIVLSPENAKRVDQLIAMNYVRYL